MVSFRGGRSGASRATTVGCGCGPCGRAVCPRSVPCAGTRRSERGVVRIVATGFVADPAGGSAVPWPGGRGRPGRLPAGPHWPGRRRSSSPRGRGGAPRLWPAGWDRRAEQLPSALAARRVCVVRRTGHAGPGATTSSTVTSTGPPTSGRTAWRTRSDVSWIGEPERQHDVDVAAALAEPDAVDPAAGEVRRDLADDARVQSVRRRAPPRRPRRRGRPVGVGRMAPTGPGRLTRPAAGALVVDAVVRPCP